MNIELNLINNRGFKWYSDKEIYVKGFAFDKEGQYYQKEEMLSLFYPIDNCQKLAELLLSLNGSFVIIIKKETEVIFGTDRLRSFPLFYEKSDDLFRVSDAIDVDQDVDKDSLEYYEFLMSGCTVGNNTLLESYKQIQPSEVICYNENGIKRKQYFKHRHQNYFKEDYCCYYRDLEKITDNFISRLIKSVGLRPLIVPLSGGYDSRYILAGLRKNNFTNVICYTYGKRDSFEVLTATKVAKELAYKLHIIEYTEEDWKKLTKDSEFQNYIKYSFNFSSLPHIQDFIALQKLTEQNSIPANSVIVPGFCGDLLGGSYVPIECKENRSGELLKLGLKNYIARRHFPNSFIREVRLREKIKNGIVSKLEVPEVLDIDCFISENEAFFTEHKVSKFIINAVRPYEFFGFEWRLPLWDNELVEYWYKVPNLLRIDSELYNDFLFQCLFCKHGVDFRKTKPLSHNNVFMVFRRIVPRGILMSLKRIYHKIIYRGNKGDVNNFGMFGDSIQSDVQDENLFRFNNINGLLAYWMLNKSK